MHCLAAACAGITMLAGPALADPPDKSILATFDRFMLTRSAATHCGWGDAVSTASFQSRYRRVAELASAALKELASDLSGAAIEKLMSDHYSEIDRRVSITVAQESCEGPRIKEALQQYATASDSDNTGLVADKNDR
jgi:hypothetical protein